MHHRTTILAFLRALVLMFATWTVQAGAVPYLSVEVPDRYVGKGEQFAITIHMNDAVDLFGYQFDFTFDPGLLTVTGVEEGRFLSAGGPTIFFPGLIDNDQGRISFTLGTLTDDLPGVNGTGELVRINFRAGDVSGISLFTVPDIIMLDSSLADIAFGPPLENYVVVVPVPGSLLLMLPLLPLLAWMSRRRISAA